MTSHPAYIVEWSAPRLTADFVRCPTERGLTGLWTRCGANLLRIVTLNDQLDMITGKGPSAHHEVSYFAESDPAAVRIDDFKYQFITQAGGWLGTEEHPDSPILVNLRLDPFERTGTPANGSLHGSQEYFGW